MKKIRLTMPILVTTSIFGMVLPLASCSCNPSHVIEKVEAISIQSDSEITLSLTNGKKWEGKTGCKLEYSLDGTNFAEWDGTTALPPSTKIYLRGTGITKFASSTVPQNSTIFKFVSASNVSMSGDIRALLNYEDANKIEMDNYCFANLFNGCAKLTTLPDLSKLTNLSDYCYSNMFNGCTGLTSLPENFLPVTTLLKYCYYNMFNGCTGLTSLPESFLPATTLADGCYCNMFNGCTGLTSLPENLLPAGKNKGSLADYCYSNMFNSCKGLTSLPENLLPATTLTKACYQQMFHSCSNLKINDGNPGKEESKQGKAFTCPTGDLPTDAVKEMFIYTGGTFKGTPTAGKTYYWYKD